MMITGDGLICLGNGIVNETDGNYPDGAKI